MPASRSIDPFYTRDSVAQACHVDLLRVMEQEGISLTHAHWLEPSAGAGAFLRLMPPGSRLGLDIAPAQDVGSLPLLVQDFLSFTPPAQWLTSSAGALICEGNPPFGRNSALAVRFFNHAAQFSRVIAFVLPQSFRKPRFQNRLSRHFHLAHDRTLVEDAFTLEGYSVRVPCCFQVWVRRQSSRPPWQGASTHPDFRFVAADAAILAVRRVGRNAGTVTEDFARYAVRSHHYLAPSIPLARFRSILESVDWAALRQHNNIIPCIGKPELVAAYERARLEFREE